ncbi:MAG: hypothetical protein EZS28_047645, partial [Streblomastix strix]
MREGVLRDQKEAEDKLFWQSLAERHDQLDIEEAKLEGIETRKQRTKDDLYNKVKVGKYNEMLDNIDINEGDAIYKGIVKTTDVFNQRPPEIDKTELHLRIKNYLIKQMQEDRDKKQKMKDEDYALGVMLRELENQKVKEMNERDWLIKKGKQEEERDLLERQMLEEKYTMPDK